MGEWVSLTYGARSLTWYHTQLVQYLSQYVVGQENAKKVLSVAYASSSIYRDVDSNYPILVFLITTIAFEQTWTIWNQMNTVRQSLTPMIWVTVSSYILVEGSVQNIYQNLGCQQPKCDLCADGPCFRYIENDHHYLKKVMFLWCKCRCFCISCRPLNRDTEVQQGLVCEIHLHRLHVVGDIYTGKTLLARTLAKVLDVPFSVSDATAFTQVCYHPAIISVHLKSISGRMCVSVSGLISATYLCSVI